MTDISCKVLVIGGGPGGYVAAIRCGQFGLDTILVERAVLGGTCLNVGCIPSKALIHAAETFCTLTDQHLARAIGIETERPKLTFNRTQSWKDGIVKRLTSGVEGLLRKAKVHIISGHAECVDGKTWTVQAGGLLQRIRADHVIIATGSVPLELNNLPFGGRVISSTQALSLAAPPQKLIVIGAGYIGLELGTAYAKLGSKVTVVEAMSQILPTYDRELTRPIAKRLKALGVDVRTATKAQAWNEAAQVLDVATTDGKIETLAADQVLVAVGRRPVTSGFGLERLGLAMNDKFVQVDERCATSMRNVWAIGDVTGEPMLAHRAMSQGQLVADNIAGHKRSFDKLAIPAICFTDPEIISVGLSPESAKRAGHHITVDLFPFVANGRAMTKQSEEGFVRIIARERDHVVLGIQAVGQGVSELSAAFGIAIEMGARLEDIADTIHAHPTQGEGFQEAALKALGAGLHA